MKFDFENSKYGAVKEGVLYRIYAKKDFDYVKTGQKGGLIEKESNLSEDGNCWVSGNARVTENAQVSDNVQVFGNARVSGDSWISDNARISGDAHIYGDAWVFGNAFITENAQVSGDVHITGHARIKRNALIKDKNDFLSIDNVGSSNGTLTIFRTEDGFKLTRGCFIGNFDQFKEAVSEKEDDDPSKEQYESLYPFIEFFQRRTK